MTEDKILKVEIADLREMIAEHMFGDPSPQRAQDGELPSIREEGQKNNQLWEHMFGST